MPAKGNRKRRSLQTCPSAHPQRNHAAPRAVFLLLPLSSSSTTACVNSAF